MHSLTEVRHAQCLLLIQFEGADFLMPKKIFYCMEDAGSMHSLSIIKKGVWCHAKFALNNFSLFGRGGGGTATNNAKPVNGADNAKLVNLVPILVTVNSLV